MFLFTYFKHFEAPEVRGTIEPTLGIIALQTEAKLMFLESHRFRLANRGGSLKEDNNNIT